MFQTKRITSTTASFSDRLLTRILVVESLITSQVALTSFPVQAAPTGFDRMQFGCGVSRPFVKGYTTWYGRVSVTTGWADSTFR